MSPQHSLSLKTGHMAAKPFLLLNFYKYLYWKITASAVIKHGGGDIDMLTKLLIQLCRIYKNLPVVLQ